MGKKRGRGLGASALSKKSAKTEVELRSVVEDEAGRRELLQFVTMKRDRRRRVGVYHGLERMRLTHPGLTAAVGTPAAARWNPP